MRQGSLSLLALSVACVAALFTAGPSWSADWRKDWATLENERHQLHEVAIHPVPLQQPHPPLWYAGTDPGAAGWAGSRGMGLALGFKPSADLLPTADFLVEIRHTLEEIDEPMKPAAAEALKVILEGSLSDLATGIRAALDAQQRAKTTEGQVTHDGDAD